MAKPHMKVLVDKIISNIRALDQHFAETSTQFKEFVQHTIDQVGLLKEEQKTNTPNKKSIFHFSVEQWPKDKIMTFFLGDEVGCCLATTNPQFQAMVQRRMDDALLFHVAVDKATNRPAALIWLYLAETEEGKIVLVANFFEVNTKYAVNETVRLALLNGLLQFTYQYLKSNPNINAFYMNRLSYGWNTRDLDSYPITDVSLVDKLGGPYIPGYSEEDIDLDKEKRLAITDQQYYLVSLNQRQFHQFDAKILEKDRSPTLTEKDAILQKAILASEKDRKKENIIEVIAAQHALELAPFYSSPMEEDPHFCKDIDAALEKALLGENKTSDLSTQPQSSLRRSSRPFFNKSSNAVQQHGDEDIHSNPPPP
ncbi:MULTISPECIES: hypothetical protein [unclassified Legionella]|uniref:hypothetical protein n=1 Tax=unclassified Legionella TaxID=2622702 RepID=UPI001055F5FD|nr:MULTISPECIES: hypothetical protein [unclassified Legionella]MDI9818478.1 hypothetical protein [Legionella sp. PL877]